MQTMDRVLEVSTIYRQEHPRRFLALIGGGILLILILLGTHSDLQDKIGESYRSYAYPPDVANLSNVAGESKFMGGWWPALGPRNLEAAVKRSELLWRRNRDKRDAFIKQEGGLARMKMFSDGWHTQWYTLWDIFLPAFPCPWEVERIGRMGDGGKLTCGLPRIRDKRGKKCVVMSFGVERESSWEAEILERTDCTIYMYDFSVKTFGPQLQAMDPAMSSRAHFHSYGIGPKDEVKDGNQFYTLETLMKQNNIDWIDILKIDVEGAEFNIIPEIIDHYGDGNLPFGQLLMEIHADRGTKPGSMEEFDGFYERMEKAGLRTFSAELNYPAIHWNPSPACSEVNFLNNCNGKKKCGTLLRD